MDNFHSLLLTRCKKLMKKWNDFTVRVSSSVNKCGLRSCIRRCEIPIIMLTLCYENADENSYNPGLGGTTEKVAYITQESKQQSAVVQSGDRFLQEKFSKAGCTA